MKQLVIAGSRRQSSPVPQAKTFQNSSLSAWSVGFANDDVASSRNAWRVILEWVSTASLMGWGSWSITLCHLAWSTSTPSASLRSGCELREVEDQIRVSGGCHRHNLPDGDLVARALRARHSSLDLAY